MQIKDLIKNTELNLKTKVKREDDRFVVDFKLNLSKEELLALGLSEPKARPKEDGPVEPTLKELMLQGFAELRKDNQEIHKRLDNIDERLAAIENTPTMQKELKSKKTKGR